MLEEQGKACRHLWLVRLELMLEDAARWGRGRPAVGGTLDDAKAAHLELLHCGPALKLAAELAGFEPEQIALAYSRKLERGEGASRVL